MIVMSIEVEDNNYDINVTPDKRDVFLKNEEEVVGMLKGKLGEFFENIQRTKAYDSQSVASSSKSKTAAKVTEDSPSELSSTS